MLLQAYIFSFFIQINNRESSINFVHFEYKIFVDYSLHCFDHVLFMRFICSILRKPDKFYFHSNKIKYVYDMIYICFQTMIPMETN